MLAGAALLFIVNFGLVIVLWPRIGRLVVLALALVLISALIQMLKANAAELVQPEHIYRYNGECNLNKSDGAPCYLLDFRYPNHLRKLVFMFTGLTAFYAYVGYDDPEETPSGETRLTVREISGGAGNYNNATGYCTITAGSALPVSINCTATVPMLGYRGHPHMTISNYMTNITD